MTLAPDPRFQSSIIRELVAYTNKPGILSLAGGLPAPELLPNEAIAAAAASALADPVTIQYGETAGYGPLRDLLAERSGRPPTEVAVTAGSQQGLSLVAHALAGPAATVLVEEPGYVGAIAAFRAAGCDLHGVKVDSNGIDVDQIADLLASGVRPAVVYCNPNFSNPTGAMLSSKRWESLCQLASTHGFWIVADDPYRELYFNAPPAKRQPHPCVIELGSTSKILAPGLRVGWVEARAEVIDRLAVAKQSVDLNTGSLSQRIVHRLLSDPAQMTAHTDHLRAAYRHRRDALVEALINGGFTPADFTVPDGGFFVWMSSEPGGPADIDLSAALAAGTAFVPGAAFRLTNNQRPELRLSYSGADVSSFPAAVAALVAAQAATSSA